MGALRAFVNGQFLESFNITFIGNIKNCEKNQLFFFFSLKKFLKIFPKPMQQCP